MILHRGRQVRQSPADLGVAVGGGVLVTHGSSGRGVTGVPHQLSQRCAGLRGKDGSGVPEVVARARN